MEIEHHDKPEGNPRVHRGLQFVEQLWWQLAKKVVRLAGELYEWDEEQWKE